VKINNILTKTQKKMAEINADEIDPNRISYGKCMICLENLYKDEHRRFLPCSHQYHEACIIPWIKVRTVCPNCKISIYVRVDEKDPEKISEEYKNPVDSRTMSEVLRERQEQQDILDQMQGELGGSQLLQGLMGEHQDEQLLSGLLVSPLISQLPNSSRGMVGIMGIMNLLEAVERIQNDQYDEQDIPEQDIPEQDIPEQDIPEQDIPEQDIPEQE
jgi:hypothetical protein